MDIPAWYLLHSYCFLIKNQCYILQNKLIYQYDVCQESHVIKRRQTGSLCFIYSFFVYSEDPGPLLHLSGSFAFNRGWRRTFSIVLAEYLS